MAAPQAKHGEILSTAANATTLKPIKFGLPLKVIVPLAAGLLFIGCAKGIKQSEGVNSMVNGSGNQAQIIAQAPAQVPDTTTIMQNIPKQLHDKDRRDWLFQKRIDDINTEARKEPVRLYSPFLPSRDPKEEYAFTMRSAMDNSAKRLYKAGKDGIPEQIEAAKTYVNEIGKLFSKDGGEKWAAGIISDFDWIMHQK